MITEEDLENLGYKFECAFRQVGNYEDEDNLYLYVKNGIAISQPYYHDIKEGIWRMAKRDEVTYADGFPDDHEIITEVTQIP